MHTNNNSTEIEDIPISTDKHMLIYYSWYRYLRLAVELDQKKIPITAGEKHYKVSVKREKYKGWDIDDILVRERGNPDAWWDEYKHLFAEISVLEIKDDAEFDADFDSYRYFKISRIKKRSEVIAELTRYLDDQKGEKKSRLGKTSRFVITGEVREKAFWDACTALTWKLNGWSYIEIADLLVSNDNDISPDYSLADGIWYRSDDTFNSSKMRDTLNLAKRTVLAVADGYFPKNPNNRYF